MFRKLKRKIVIWWKLRQLRKNDPFVYEDEHYNDRANK